MPRIATTTVLRRFAAACLLCSAQMAAQSADRLDIDIWPGLAGQPQARRDLITEYIRIPSVSHPAGTPAELNQTNFIRVRSLAARKSPLNPATNMRFYKNLDIHSADNSNGAKALTGSAVPGDIGANPISDTLPDWIIARMGSGGVDLPAFESHPTAEQH